MMITKDFDGKKNIKYDGKLRLKLFEKIGDIKFNYSTKLDINYVELIRDYRSFFLQISLGLLAIVGAVGYNFHYITILVDNNVVLVRVILLCFILFILFSFLHLYFMYLMTLYYAFKDDDKWNNKFRTLINDKVKNIEKNNRSKDINLQIVKKNSVEYILYKNSLIRLILLIFSICAALSFVGASVGFLVLVYRLINIAG